MTTVGDGNLMLAARKAAQMIERAGSAFTLHAPVRRGSLWVVAIEDVLGERVEKSFSSHVKAMDAYTELWLGQSRTEAKAAELTDAGIAGARDRGDPVKGAMLAAKPGDAQTRTAHNRKAPLNLRKVAEVLGSYGLDPTVELAEILTPIVTVDPDTGIETEKHRLDSQQRASLLVELLQYAHPKLKAVEMKVEGNIASMTQEQIDQRLAQLIAKAARA